MFKLTLWMLMEIKKSIIKKLNEPTEAAPLAVFRILFGLIMLWSLIRFWAYGWIYKLYLAPKLHFTYFGFEWVRSPGIYIYLLFIVAIVSTVFIVLGYKYRWAMTVFFLCFTYIELIDKTTYLNHYYFISLLSLLLIFLPANSYFSIDAKSKTDIGYQKLPKWTIWAVMLFLGIVYFYAGVAKINSEWLVKAMPLKIWLPSKYDLPFLGNLLQKEWVAYLFSWSGMLYDLCIPFLLFWRKTRPFAFIIVIIFHVLTAALFPIGMFPYIMIGCSFIFFDTGFHHRVLAMIAAIIKCDKSQFDNGLTLAQNGTVVSKLTKPILTVFFAFHILFPFRYLLYPGNLFWTEEGYRFSWRVMLMEKAGYAQFKIINTKTNESFYINNDDHLTPFQEKQMSTQPDFMLQYAQYLSNQFGAENIEVFVDSYVALNGRGSRRYIDPTINLLEQRDDFLHKDWILDFEE